MIVGQEKPDAGDARVGDTVQLATSTSRRDDLDPDNTVWEGDLRRRRRSSSSASAR
jgi:sulfate-transporting ATPase